MSNSGSETWQDMRGKVAVVTGAASGAGLGCAAEFARLGMRVALLDVREDELRVAVERLRSDGADAMGVVTDVSKAESVDAAARRVHDELGDVSVLMNNAAVFLRGLTMQDAPDAAWNWLFGVNLYGVIHGVRAFLPRMRERGTRGYIVNTGSIGGVVVGDRQNGIYSAAKFALVAFSEALGFELAGTSIQVSVLLPAAIRTDFYVNSAQLRGNLAGPNLFAETPPDIAAGMKPCELARRVVKGMRAGLFFIPTHPETRFLVEQRHARLMAAYDFADRHFKD